METGEPIIEPTAGHPSQPADALSMQAQKIDTLLRRAHDAHQQGRLAEAEIGYRDVLAIDATQPDALHWSGVIHFQQGRIEQADVLMGRAIDIAPTPLALSNHAAVLVSLGRREAAQQRLERALAINPAHSRSRIQYADLLAEAAQPAQALEHYDALLAQMPGVADLWAKRAAMLLALAQPEAALESSEQALRVDSRSFAARVEHGHASHALGRYEQALESYKQALARSPQDVNVLIARGVALADAGRVEDALASFNEAIAVSPSHCSALHNSAVALERLGRIGEALERCERVLAIDAMHRGALANRGNALFALGRFTEALSSLDAALEQMPDSLEVLGNRARALQSLKRYPEALDTCVRALALNARFAPAWYVKGMVQQRLHEYDDALASFDAALANDAHHLYACFQRGNTLRMLWRHEEALLAYDRVLESDPDNVLSHFSKAFVYLTLGEFERGWQEYEWRWNEDQVGGTRRAFAQPLWLGDAPLEGKTILLHAEQGLGDTVQFVRYIEQVKALGATVVLEVQSPLKRLLARMPGIDAIVSHGAPLPPFDVHCPLLSLALAFRTQEASIPNTVPYLSVDATRLAQWKTRLGPREDTKPRPRIGLAWSGNPRHLDDHNRSMPFSICVPLLDERFEWFSLQKIVRDDDRVDLEASGIRHFGETLEDFDDTAALVHEMDLVISVDTSVAHLAGALGRPLWVMLPYLSDWRWRLEGETSAWYPSARLLRQSRAGDWQSVFDRIADELATLR